MTHDQANTIVDNLHAIEFQLLCLAAILVLVLSALRRRK